MVVTFLVRNAGFSLAPSEMMNLDLSGDKWIIGSIPNGVASSIFTGYLGVRCISSSFLHSSR